MKFFVHELIQTLHESTVCAATVSAVAMVPDFGTKGQ